jgi:TolA-binding protein
MKAHFITAAVLAAFASTAGAQSMKPGLWEVTNKVQSGSGQMEQQMAEMQKQMANMPPEQRKMMEDMMKQHGMKLGSPGGGMSTQVCVTKEMAERNEVATRQDGNCTSKHSTRSGNTMKVSFTCTNPPSSGEGEVTFMGPDGYAMKMTVNTSVQGRPEKMTMDGSGKWLGADCGSVKPFPLAPKK